MYKYVGNKLVNAATNYTELKLGYENALRH